MPRPTTPLLENYDAIIDEVEETYSWCMAQNVKRWIDLHNQNAIHLCDVSRGPVDTGPNEYHWWDGWLHGLTLFLVHQGLAVSDADAVAAVVQDYYQL